MAPAQGPHCAQGTQRLERPQGRETKAQTVASTNKHSHLSLPSLSLSQLIRIAEQSFQFIVGVGQG